MSKDWQYVIGIRKARYGVVTSKRGCHKGFGKSFLSYGARHRALSSERAD